MKRSCWAIIAVVKGGKLKFGPHLMVKPMTDARTYDVLKTIARQEIPGSNP